jgi:hypothetical protein
MKRKGPLSTNNKALMRSDKTGAPKTYNRTVIVTAPRTSWLIPNDTNGSNHMTAFQHDNITDTMVETYLPHAGQRD